MFDWFSQLGHVWQALLATLFTWAVTAAGAGLVFCVRGARRTALDAMLGFAAGIMTAASFWSLLSPALEQAETVTAHLTEKAVHAITMEDISGSGTYSC